VNHTIYLGQCKRSEKKGTRSLKATLFIVRAAQSTIKLQTCHYKITTKSTIYGANKG